MSPTGCKITCDSGDHVRELEHLFLNNGGGDINPGIFLEHKSGSVEIKFASEYVIDQISLSSSAHSVEIFNGSYFEYVKTMTFSNSNKDKDYKDCFCFEYKLPPDVHILKIKLIGESGKDINVKKGNLKITSLKKGPSTSKIIWADVQNRLDSGTDKVIISKQGKQFLSSLVQQQEASLNNNPPVNMLSMFASMMMKKNAQTTGANIPIKATSNYKSEDVNDTEMIKDKANLKSKNHIPECSYSGSKSDLKKEIAAPNVNDINGDLISRFENILDRKLSLIEKNLETVLDAKLSQLETRLLIKIDSKFDNLEKKIQTPETPNK